ncbi:hypothetical protein BATDEDRAFT_21460 [Batrachochytrium dendrobatidis JAM81]|uniref:Uncharacterized protein n=1 Tax=Batrachochytrium dendrobatidis (strain JAM81 / FGSC 10211) TaxID=684364 RepID=F4NT77_BATDJ|nr:uncharacterized protein BATDEDRAFT_21460 [Batrachochytrium dendrobatidis JAM81]EGF83896.1 hypothetical protein BATDEDRAFT_21460 [Batrachochytrium dendrobatidis JAM81]|eukprot:XP_006675294.1 hypothetical protein BATDEDRAFT_21460 [Batrachochytrium dendrobatidis JAM81]
MGFRASRTPSATRKQAGLASTSISIDDISGLSSHHASLQLLQLAKRQILSSRVSGNDSQGLQSSHIMHRHEIPSYQNGTQQHIQKKDRSEGIHHSQQLSHSSNALSRPITGVDADQPILTAPVHQSGRDQFHTDAYRAQSSIRNKGIQFSTIASPSAYSSINANGTPIVIGRKSLGVFESSIGRPSTVAAENTIFAKVDNTDSAHFYRENGGNVACVGIQSPSQHQSYHCSKHSIYQNKVDLTKKKPSGAPNVKGNPTPLEGISIRSNKSKAFVAGYWDNVPLTQNNLKRHTEMAEKKHTLTAMERIASWIQSIPDDFEDPFTPLLPSNSYTEPLSKSNIHVVGISSTCLSSQSVGNIADPIDHGSAHGSSQLESASQKNTYTKLESLPKKHPTNSRRKSMPGEPVSSMPNLGISSKPTRASNPTLSNANITLNNIQYMHDADQVSFQGKPHTSDGKFHFNSSRTLEGANCTADSAMLRDPYYCTPRINTSATAHNTKQYGSSTKLTHNYTTTLNDSASPLANATGAHRDQTTLLPNKSHNAKHGHAGGNEMASQNTKTALHVKNQTCYGSPLLASKTLWTKRVGSMLKSNTDSRQEQSAASKPMQHVTYTGMTTSIPQLNSHLHHQNQSSTSRPVTGLSKSSISRNEPSSASKLPRKHIKLHVDRGRLLCCLKVEIKAGVYRMLPVHERDEAHALATTFCKGNNLMGSVESLLDHIQLSMKTYG